MTTTIELIGRVRARGANLLLLGKRLRVLRPEVLERATIEELRREKPAVLRALEVELAATAIVYDCVLREYRRSS